MTRATRATGCARMLRVASFCALMRVPGNDEPHGTHGAYGKHGANGPNGAHGLLTDFMNDNTKASFFSQSSFLLASSTALRNASPRKNSFL